jgi:hypothetical protein
MPGTAREQAGKMGIGYDYGRLTSDPSYNVMLGSAYFRRLVNIWDGNYPLAVASYNAGAGNVRKWVNSFGDPRGTSTLSAGSRRSHSRRPAVMSSVLKTAWSMIGSIIAAGTADRPYSAYLGKSSRLANRHYERRPPWYITPQGFRASAPNMSSCSEKTAQDRGNSVWAASLGVVPEMPIISTAKSGWEIDRRFSYLSKVMKSAKVVDPAKQEQRDSVIRRHHRAGRGEVCPCRDAGRRRYSMPSKADQLGRPIARALIGAKAGDEQSFSFLLAKRAMKSGDQLPGLALVR